MIRLSPTLTLTAVGAGVVSGAIVVGGLGWIFGYTVLTGIGVAALVISVIAALTTRGVPDLTVERIIEPTTVERGQPAHGLVSVRNRTTRPTAACQARDRVIDTGGGRVDEHVEVDIPRLRRGQSIAVPYQLPTTRRGVLQVGPLSIDRSDPFGLFVAQRTVGSAIDVRVEPRVIKLDPRPSGRLRHLDGPTSESASSGTLTFHSLREYTRGDDVRRVHWPSTARTGTLMVREQVDTSQPSTVIVVDVRAERYVHDDFEEAIDVAASMVAASDRLGFPIRLITTSGQTAAVRAGQHAGELRTLLSSMQPVPSNGPINHRVGGPIDGRADGRVGGTVDGRADGRVGGTVDGMAVAASLVVGHRDRDAIIVITGAVDLTDLGHITMMCRRFERPALVTIRPDTGSTSAPPTARPTWTDGAHHDGATAERALSRWQVTAGRRGTP